MSERILNIIVRSYGKTKGQVKDSLSTPTPRNRTLTINVPKKVFKRAVDRNKVKRLIRESFRLVTKDIGDLSGIQIKISPMASIFTVDFDTITTQIKNEIKKYV
jgi:ribonuclease P protein component